MSNDERYNGWTNRETWALMLYINNDQGLYESALELVQRHAAEGDDVSGELSMWVTELLNPDEYQSLYGERQTEGLARMAFEIGSLWRINWTEVVASLLED